MFEIVEPGIMTTVQDLGRPEYSSMGIPISGAADTFSLKIGSLLVGNSLGEAALEIVLYGLQLRALKRMIIAITGPDFGARLNNKEISMWRTIEIAKGDLISFPPFKLSSRKGCRSYLTVAGGFDVAVFLGSKSTYIPGNFGGFKGRVLKKGDKIQVGRSRLPFGKLRNRKFNEKMIPSFEDKWKVRVILGPNDHLFTKESIEMFLRQDWRVSYKASRFGVRYIGPKLDFIHRTSDQIRKGPRSDPSNIPTQGVPLGAIEVMGGEEIAVIGVDGPSITGFTIIATVISADMWKIGQSKPNDTTCFKKVEINEAYELLIKSEKLVQQNNILTG